jgi:hypothetical protein
MMRRSAYIASAVSFAILFAPSNVLAQSRDGFAKVQATIFRTIERNGDGAVSEPETRDFGNLAFASPDADDKGYFSLTDFLTFGLGWQAEALSSPSHQAVIRRFKTPVFRVWDRNADGRLTHPEMQGALTFEHVSADADRDGRLAMSEFAGARYFRGLLLIALERT